MANKSRPRLTDEEREERRRADRERLHKSAEQLLSSDGRQRWVRVRFGYCVRKSEKAITGGAIGGCRADAARPPSEPLTGDSQAHRLAPPQMFTQSLGFTVSFEPIPRQTGGWCDQKARRIVVDAVSPRTRSCGF
jgi:hypothetical protein